MRIAASGLLSQQRALDVVSNNLANLQTPGYKKSRVELKDVVYRPAPGVEIEEGDPALVDYAEGAGVMVGAVQHDLAQGPFEDTGDPLDLGLDGPGFLRVKLADGSTAYTRDGHFSVNSAGQVIDRNGNPLDPPIAVPAGARIERIDPTGEVWARGPQGEPSVIGRVSIATFVNPGGLSAIGQNLFVESTASGPETTVAPGAPGRPALLSGRLERANVDVADEMTRMIQAQRAYQLNLEALRVSDNLAAQAINVRR
jgi:flagellar basal-body rod protein FlgG